MKLNDGFITYESDDQHILVATGGQQFAGLVRSNESAAYIIELFKTDTSREDAVKALMDHYDIDETTAAAGVDKVLDQLRRIGALDE